MNDLDTLPCYKLYAVALRFNLSEAIAERNAFNCECERHDLLARKMQMTFASPQSPDCELLSSDRMCRRGLWRPWEAKVMAWFMPSP